jgi:hypothetical protein
MAKKKAEPAVTEPKAETITAERLREILDYNPESGTFRWRVYRAPNARPGDTAGTDHREGYRTIRVGNRPYLAHRLAWVYTHGRWPTHQLDHINRDRQDNRIANLRECTNAENCQNVLAHRDGTSTVAGVSWQCNRKKWQAKICVNGRQHFLGYFVDKSAAKAAYLAAKKSMHAFSGGA